MSYQPVEKSPDADEGKEFELGEDSVTDVEGCSRDSNDAFFLGWKRRHCGRIPHIRDLYNKARDANVPLVVSLHMLVLNLILSVVLVSQLWRGSQCGPTKAKLDSQLAPGELLWSQFPISAKFVIFPVCESLFYSQGLTV